jgi:Glucodextranase, domain B
VQPSRVKSRPAPPTRSAGRRTGPQATPLSWAAKAALAVAVVVFGIVVLFNAPGVIGGFAGGISRAIGGVVDKLSQTAEPSATLLVLPPAPSLTVPTQPYTNQPTLDLTGTISNSIVGQTGYTIRIYRKVGTASPVKVSEIPVGSSPSFTVPAVALAAGSDAFTATVVSPAGESPPSIAVTYILDQAKPKIVITSPTKNAVVNGAAVTITGQTQAGSSVSARNEANGLTAVATADNVGAFSVIVALAGGVNGISVTATDPAGNVGAVVISVQRGTGQLTVRLTASAYHMTASRSNTIAMTVVVLDPNGAPLSGATVTLTLSVPNQPAFVLPQKVTTANGTLVFKTTIAPTVAGKGEIAVVVDTTDYGQVTAQVPITFS